MKKKRTVIAIILGGALAVIAFFSLTHYFGFGVVSGNAMSPTYQDGQKIMQQKYVRELSYGDVVWYQISEGEYQGTYLRRVVGKAGDTIELINGSLYRNGELVKEDAYKVSSDTMHEGPYTVEQGQVFVLGDNRTDSIDSRTYGSIPETCIYAKS